ncbi:hypothetical protein CN082_26265 [Sinorhizobium meliloti]|nr:hypothetical protein CN082_26265 [Sinorhizobium meliloti]
MNLDSRTYRICWDHFGLSGRHLQPKLFTNSRPERFRSHVGETRENPQAAWRHRVFSPTVQEQAQRRARSPHLIDVFTIFSSLAPVGVSESSRAG